MKIRRSKIVFKFIKLFMFRIIKRKWYLPGVPEITVDKLHEQINSDEPPILVDLRYEKDFYAAEGADYKYGHILNAKLVPFMEFSEKSQQLFSLKEKEIITICYGGGASLAIAEVLLKSDFKDVKSLQGGMELWHKKDYPTTVSMD
jgi:rhodanese-related sulfurtransferase